jgi:hypothetical protein
VHRLRHPPPHPGRPHRPSRQSRPDNAAEPDRSVLGLPREEDRGRSPSGTARRERQREGQGKRDGGEREPP